IFEPFFSTKSAGRGLGLAASQGIARGHGGVLRVSSSPGRGSSFQLLLPAMVHPEPEQASAGAEQPAAESRGQILVIDPDGAARQLAREHFARLGFEVLEATDGASALAAFGRSRERLALVLLDVAASQGAEALEILRALRRLEPALPVVLGTELPEAEAAERYAEAQPAGFARKPYKLAHLERVVRSKIASHPVS
ncbi:MAG: response regulator, partial [Acidobacteriota bacterium]